jgi:integrase
MAAKRRGHGEGSVTWDADAQRWVARLPRDERGRRLKVTGKTRAEAQRKLRQKLLEREQRLVVAARRTTVRAYLEGWVRDTVMPSGLAASTKQKHEIAVRLHLVPGLGRVQLAALTPAQVQRWMRDELEAGTGAATLQVAHGSLRVALEQAVLWGLASRNVARLVKAPAYSARERRPFSGAEQAAILAAARPDRLYVMVVLAQSTGLRQSELLGLRWSSFDLDGVRLHLTKQLGRDGALKDVKTEAGNRVLPLPSPVVDLLRTHRQEQERERAEALVWEDRDLVLCTRTGGRSASPTRSAPGRA